MFYFFAIIGIITCFILSGTVFLWLLTVDKDETLKSILYDDPDYFKNDEPRWMRREVEDDET